MTDTNLHTIRLPSSTFFPATVSTNLLFFEKGNQTKDIWYYEHKLPKGQKSYSKTKAIQFSEFEPLIKWWNNREENNQAWKVNINDLKNWDLDVKNPTKEEEKEILDFDEIITKLENEKHFENSFFRDITLEYLCGSKTLIIFLFGFTS